MGTGIVVFAAPSPINDVYGDADVQGIEPFYYYANGLIGAQIVITDKAKDKDLPALFTFLDYFFSPEGSVLATYGLNADQLKELETLCPAAYELYQTLGLSEGAYTVENGKYKRNPLYLVNDDVAGLAALLRFIRLEDLSNLQNDYPAYRRIAKGGCSHHFWQRLEMFAILKSSLAPQPKKTLNPSSLVLSLESFARIQSLADWRFDGNLLFDRANVVSLPLML